MCERQASKRFAEARKRKRLHDEIRLIERMKKSHPHAFKQLRGHGRQYHKAAELFCLEWESNKRYV